MLSLPEPDVNQIKYIQHTYIEHIHIYTIRTRKNMGLYVVYMFKFRGEI